MSLMFNIWDKKLLYNKCMISLIWIKDMKALNTEYRILTISAVILEFNLTEIFLIFKIITAAHCVSERFFYLKELQLVIDNFSEIY